MADRIIALRGGTLIDGTGAAPVDGAVVVMRNDRVEAVGPAAKVSIPPDAQLVDTSGATVMPGLIDAHVHLAGIRTINPVTWFVDHPFQLAMRSAMDVWKVIDAGFTTVRDAGCANGIYLRRCVGEGSLVGPRIVAAGLTITQTGGHGDPGHFFPVEWVNQRNLLGRLADGVPECRKAVREQLREGADYIKIMATGGVMSEKDKPTSCQFSLEELRAITEEARNAGVRTAAHAHATQGIKNSLLSGVDCIEHGIFLDDECIDLMLERGVYLVPTLAIVDALVTKGAEFGLPAVNQKKAISVQHAHIESVHRARQAGVKIGLGTDYASDRMCPMGENAVELDIYVNKMGFSPMEAIVCATKVNSEVLGLSDQIGTLEAGKLADLIVVDGDPLADIRILWDRKRILSVYKGGAPVPRLPF